MVADHNMFNEMNKKINSKLEVLNTKLDNSHKEIQTTWKLFIVMTFILAVLKLMGYINITWLWVFSPLWIPPAIGLTFLLSVIGVIILFFVFAIIAVVIGHFT